MSRSISIVAVLFIFLSIILGALAAHSLEKSISSELIKSFEKGVKYMMYSGLGLLILSINNRQFRFELKWVFRLIVIGTILFSGNIFLYVFHVQVPIFKNFVHIVPIGGLLMIVGWGLLLVKLFKVNSGSLK